MYSFVRDKTEARQCTECAAEIKILGEYFWWREAAPPDQDQGPEEAGHCMCTACAEKTDFSCPHSGATVALASILGGHCPECYVED